MNKEQLFYEIREKSIFSFLDPSHDAKILEYLEIMDLNEGEDVLSGDTENLFIVANGEVELIDRNSKKVVGVVEQGRSLELMSFLKEQEQWNYNFNAKVNSSIFVLPKHKFRSLFSLKPRLIHYLKRVTFFPEFRKMKNDLSLLGFSSDEIIDLVCAFDFHDFERFGLGVREKLYLVNKGRLSIKMQDGYDEIEITQFNVGDSFKWIPDEALNCEGEKLTLWTLNKEKLDAVGITHIYEQLLSIFDPLKKELEELKNIKETQQERKQLIIEDDDLTVDDFKLEKLGKLKKRKAVHVKQHDQMDCGAACMSTIAKYYGRNISVASYRSLIHVTREGASMFSLKQAAEKTGFESIGIYSGLKALKGMVLPAIALMQYHFVVVYEIRDDYVLVSDPGIGIRKMPIDEFKSQWSGNTMCLKVTPKFKKYPESASSWSKYLKVFRGIWGGVFDVITASVILFFFGLAMPLFLQFIFDSVLVEQKEGMLHGLAAIMILLTFIQSYLSWAKSILITKLSAKTELKFSALFLMHVLKLPLGFFAVRNVGDITTRIGEMDSIRSFVTNQTIATFMNLLSLFVYGGVIYLYSPKLALYLGVSVPIMMVVIFYFGKLIKEKYNELFAKMAKFQSLVYEQLDSFTTIKSLNASMYANWRWKQKFDDSLKDKQSLETVIAIFSGIKEFFNEFFRVALLGFAIYLYMQEELSLGQVVAVNALSASIMAPIIALFSLWDEYKKVQVSFDKVDDIFTAAPERESDPREVVELKSDDIQYQDISFQYGSELSPVILDEVYLNIEQGQTVAFVGGSGSGKTTLAYMVAGLYVPRKGKISIGGVDLAEIPLRQLRSKVKIVLQENNLFSGTVIENIALGSQSPSFGHVIRAAELADAHEFISKLPHGYNTRLGEKGMGALSGGQMQRINIARAFYANPEILILDEATSSLDALSEEKIIENLKKRKQQTTIIIAHRLNTISYADKIVVMDQGRIVEQGSHPELIKRRGRYYSLFKKQLNF